MVPIGHIESVFTEKNGTTRQSQLCPMSRGRLTIDSGVPNPHHALDSLGEFSHVWLIFIFHDNRNDEKGIKNKVSPPRLEGAKVGVFSTRSPHRPNPIGLSLAKLDKVEGATLHLSGIDLIDGTPILDVKPYIELYDHVRDSKVAPWILEAPRPPLSCVKFTEESLVQLEKLLFS
eukprot:TRINITY_DN4192_c0_g1_i1.p1 TRINITY_DN4192_c0_g1~~TRINITY_DN4192_c0_g1_i1.p1  ORF type:complete len:195 (+),score=35.80 TRINITY_DN4192_c0_g1_i1:61-585(+)